MYKVIIFDLDGTVADTIHAVKEALDLMLADFGYKTLSMEKLLTFFSGSARQYAENALPEQVSKNKLLCDECTERFDARYAQTYLHTDKCYDGIPEALEALSKDFRLAMLSNKQDAFVDALVKQLFRPGLFDYAHGVRPGIPPKPDPAAPLEFARHFSVRPDECIYIGDSEYDYYTAVNSGMLPLCVTWGYKDEADLRGHGCEYIAHTPGEMVELIYKLNRGE